MSFFVYGAAHGAATGNELEVAADEAGLIGPIFGLVHTAPQSN